VAVIGDISLSGYRDGERVNVGDIHQYAKVVSYADVGTAVYELPLWVGSPVDSGAVALNVTHPWTA
jgi:hypothetical protein